jgi:SPP1 gp7 family putative phage head morphogenesis protein
MNSEQLRLFLSGAFGSEAEAKKIMKLLVPYLAAALQEIRALVDLLPNESLRRQQEWRALLPQIEEIMGPYNDAFLVTLEQELPIDGLKAAQETTLQLRSVVPRTAGLLPPEVVMADSTKYFLNTKVNDKRVVDFFLRQDGTSPFMKSNRRMIDSIVTGGIILGDSTESISKAIAEELPQRTLSQGRAIARTAIQDYNRQVKEDVWDANREAFARLGLKYEWVAALDSRTCQTCAPLDGAVKDKKEDFPKTPVHVNCRCQVVLVDPEDPGRVRYGQQAYDSKPTGQGVYKTKKKVKGEDLYRKNVEVKTVNGQSPRYADFLANSNRTTQAMFFGGGNAGATRAERFRRSIDSGKSPQQALIDLTNRVDPKAKVNTERGVTRRFKPVID